MEEFFKQLTNGLAVGGIYALIALGYTMVYGILRLINFAHGDLFTLGAYLGFTLLVSLGLQDAMSGLAVAGVLIVMAMGLVALVGYLLERVAYRPLRRSNRLAAVVSALGASIFFSNAIMLVWGARVKVYPSGILPDATVSILGVDIMLTRVVLFCCAVVLMLLLFWFINRTRVGTAIRAVAIDQDAARLMGINVNNIISLVFLIGPALGGAAGVMVGLYYGQISHDMGFGFGLKAFTAAILGGIGNIPGAMLGGILLGVIEAMGATYISMAWKDAVAFGVLILILIVRPTGLLGERVADKI
ncbi:leucine/isoleucine/valine transporter subunit; membrane component of ABC superfamily [uncultured delta proteobacterium]|uniref:Leucine/isoleucine/valine transporter subunit membrane component of ABC superfamily n=1 Tax=uncultured delta proteobacterium TaxID=34034 RepID=A0A212JD92_9DELT|nr:leucine/isoleucine/valine transporter subunit; membrane component of ABC superfamily [uncultured delta proteobacterium]